MYIEYFIIGCAADEFLHKSSNLFPELLVKSVFFLFCFCPAGLRVSGVNWSFMLKFSVKLGSFLGFASRV